MDKFSLKNKFIKVRNRLCYAFKFVVFYIKTPIEKKTYKQTSKIITILNLSGPILAVVLLLLSFVFFAKDSCKLAIYYENKLLAIAEDEHSYQKSINNIFEILSDEALTEVDVDLFPKYKITFSSKKANSTQEIEQNFLSIFTGKLVKGYGLYVDNKLIVCSKIEGDLERILNNILEEYKIKNPDAIDVSFFNDITIQYGIFPAAFQQESDDIFKTLTNIKEENFKHEIQTGESIDFISQAYGISQENIFEQNPLLIPGEALPYGHNLQLSKKTRVLNVKVTKEEVYTTNLNFETKVIIDTNDYLNSIKVVQNGADGVQEKKDVVGFVEGEEVSRKNLSTNTITEAKQQIISKGVKALPNSQITGVATGKFIWPVPFTKNISSYFGIRWKKQHKGIDIASHGVNGQNIVASDAGTIIQASDNKNGYGNCVIIQHNDKFSTLYGHCSAILVSVGNKVAQGQVIATVGSTGNSTGPHLHFEIRENNVAIDPLTLVIK